MSAGGTEVVQFWFHSRMLLLQADTTDETIGGLYRDESMRPSHAKVVPNYGSYWSGQGEGEVR